MGGNFPPGFFLIFRVVFECLDCFNGDFQLQVIHDDDARLFSVIFDDFLFIFDAFSMIFCDYQTKFSQGGNKKGMSLAAKNHR